MLCGQVDSLEIGEDGRIDPEHVKDLLKTLLDEKPYLRKITRAQRSAEVAAKGGSPPSPQPKVPTVKKSNGDDADDIASQISKLNQQGRGEEAFIPWWTRWVKKSAENKKVSAEPFKMK